MALVKGGTDFEDARITEDDSGASSSLGKHSSNRNEISRYLIAVLCDHIVIQVGPCASLVIEDPNFLLELDHAVDTQNISALSCQRELVRSPEILPGIEKALQVGRAQQSLSLFPHR